MHAPNGTVEESFEVVDTAQRTFSYSCGSKECDPAGTLGSPPVAMVLPELIVSQIRTAQDVGLTDPRVVEIDGCRLYTTFLEGPGLVW